MNGPQPPTPTEHHQMLNKFEGRFRAEVTIFMGGDQSMQSTGTMENSFQLGGLYLQQDYQGDPYVEGGPAFAGKGYWGYNTTTRQFEGFWIDNASTTMTIEKGAVDESGTTWTMNSTFVIPGQGIEMQRRSVITLIDDNHHTMESYVTPPGQQEMKNMEIRYQRLSASA